MARARKLGTQRNLTEREMEVFFELVQGKTNTVIAQDMFLSEGTIKTHTHNIYQKFGVHTRKELLDLAQIETQRTSEEPVKGE